jgi:hypothetical protein
MNTLDTLIAAIVTAARAAALKVIVSELADLFDRADVAAFAASWFAGGAERIALRVEILRELDGLATLAAEKGADDGLAGDAERATKRLAVAAAIGHLRGIVAEGNRYGARSIRTNDDRCDERRVHVARAFDAVSRAA